MNLKNEIIRKYCPSALTIEKTYETDEAMVLQVCQEFNCNRDEIIFTKSEVKQLMKYTEIPIKITMMDFSNTTFEEALCEITSQY